MPRYHCTSSTSGAELASPLRQHALLAVCLLGTLVLAVPPAFSQEGEPLVPTDVPWVPMQELTTGIEPTDSSVAQIWQAEMQAEADAVRSDDGMFFMGGELTTLPDDGFLPTDFLAAEFETEDAYHVVSIMFQRPPACDNGPNTFASTQIHSVCPARLTTIPKDGGEPHTVEQSGSCAIGPSALIEPEPDTGTFARMLGDMIEIEARQGGEPVPDCHVSFSLDN